jgi:hypothetical protein
MKRTDSDVREIERNIDETRMSLRSTLEALERKLSPDTLLHQTVDRFRATGGEFAGNLTHTVRDNPLPTLLTSIGLAWLMIGSRQNGRPRYAGDGYDEHEGDGQLHRAADSAREAAGRARNAASSAAERVRGAAQAARERVHGMAESARHARDGASERARGMADSARHAAYSARDMAHSAREGIAHAHERADRLAQEQPLVLGAIGLAAGALIGAIMPPAEALGERMHSGMDRAREKAGRMRDRLQEKADELRAAGESSSTNDEQRATSGFETGSSSEERLGNDSTTDPDRYSPTTH